MIFCRTVFVDFNLSNDFVPTHKELYNTDPPIMDYQPDFNHQLSKLNANERFQINSSLAGRSLLKTEKRSSEFISS